MIHPSWVEINYNQSRIDEHTNALKVPDFLTENNKFYSQVQSKMQTSQFYLTCEHP